jgi:hypothetical protein
MGEASMDSGVIEALLPIVAASIDLPIKQAPPKNAMKNCLKISIEHL